MPSNLAAMLRLMVVTDDAFLGERDLLAVCRAAVRGGVTCIELRLKRPEDVLPVRAAGGAGLAVGSGILGAGEVENAARAYSL